MEVVIDKDNRIVEIWVKHNEYGNEKVEEEIKMYSSLYAPLKYKTVVFHSGTKNLSDYMEALIRNNKYKFLKDTMQSK